MKSAKAPGTMYVCCGIDTSPVQSQETLEGLVIMLAEVLRFWSCSNTIPVTQKNGAWIFKDMESWELLQMHEDPFFFEPSILNIPIN